MTVIEHPMLTPLRAGARRVAFVAACTPRYDELLDDDTIVKVACELGGAPDCFVPVESARDAILSTYREAREVLSA